MNSQEQKPAAHPCVAEIQGKAWHHLKAVLAYGTNVDQIMEDYEGLSLQREQEQYNEDSAQDELECAEDDKDDAADWEIDLEYTSQCRYCGWMPELEASHIGHSMWSGCKYIQSRYDTKRDEEDGEPMWRTKGDTGPFQGC
jgi:hypothetical protein